MVKMKKLKILSIERTITHRGTLKYWCKTEGNSQPVNTTWFEVSEREIVEEGCDCIYESNSRFGKEKECKHLTCCREIVIDIIKN